MASTSAALNGALLVAALCVALLHSSMGQQPTPTPGCHDDYKGQKPAAPTPAPAPAPVPTPAAAPAPAVVYCSSCTPQCNSKCNAYVTDGLAKCDADNLKAFNSCYDSCTTHNCPGKSCVHSGCGYGNCTCENTNASDCCKQCGSYLGYTYNQCRSSYQRGSYYCMLSCTNHCYSNCTQG